MYNIKVIRYNFEKEDKDIHVHGTVTTLYQCARVTFRLIERHTGTQVSLMTRKEWEEATVPGNHFDLMVDLEGCPDGKSMSLQLERKNLGVYIMNDQGDTIDSYFYGQKVKK